MACLSCDVKNRGDYVTLSIADVPVLVSRSEDGKGEAFGEVIGVALALEYRPSQPTTA